MSRELPQPPFNYERIPESFHPYFHAIEDATLEQYFLQRLNHASTAYLDDLPAVDVRTLATLDDQGRFVGDNYKCRGNYIVARASELGLILDHNLIKDETVKQQIEAFIHHDFKFHHGEFTTPEEIALINTTLDVTMNYLVNTIVAAPIQDNLSLS